MSPTVRTASRSGRLVKDAVTHLVVVTTVTTDQRDRHMRPFVRRILQYVSESLRWSRGQGTDAGSCQPDGGTAAKDENCVAIGDVLIDAIPLRYLHPRRRAFPAASRWATPRSSPVHCRHIPGGRKKSVISSLSPRRRPLDNLNSRPFADESYEANQLATHTNTLGYMNGIILTSALHVEQVDPENTSRRCSDRTRTTARATRLNV